MVRRAYSPGVYPVRPVGALDDSQGWSPWALDDSQGRNPWSLDDSQGRNPWPLRVPGIIMDRRPSVYYRLDYDGASARLAAVFRGGSDDGFTGSDIVLGVSIVCLY